jgi:hypothetical protein
MDVRTLLALNSTSNSNEIGIKVIRDKIARRYSYSEQADYGDIIGSGRGELNPGGFSTIVHGSDLGWGMTARCGNLNNLSLQEKRKVKCNTFGYGQL